MNVANIEKQIGRKEFLVDEFDHPFLRSVFNFIVASLIPRPHPKTGGNILSTFYWMESEIEETKKTIYS